MARKGKTRTRRTNSALGAGRKRVLVVLFVPSLERDGATPIDEVLWVTFPLELSGRVCGGARASPRAGGFWRDDERAGVLVKDEPVLIHCYTTPQDIQDLVNLAELGRFCRRLGREAKQGEVGLVVGDEYFAAREFEEV